MGELCGTDELRRHPRRQATATLRSGSRLCQAGSTIVVAPIPITTRIRRPPRSRQGERVATRCRTSGPAGEHWARDFEWVPARTTRDCRAAQPPFVRMSPARRGHRRRCPTRNHSPAPTRHQQRDQPVGSEPRRNHSTSSRAERRASEVTRASDPRRRAARDPDDRCTGCRRRPLDALRERSHLAFGCRHILCGWGPSSCALSCQRTDAPSLTSPNWVGVGCRRRRIAAAQSGEVV